jgi:hypothetical protein
VQSARPDLETLERLRNDLPQFAAECLKVRDKAGDIVPLALNAAQCYAHDLIEAQRLSKGWVRAIILKGRQQGFSTYVAARYYHRASMGLGVNVYILAHEQAASDALFGIVDRYHRNNPLKPSVGVSNVKELQFDRLDSSYIVATAGAKAGGRSRSISLFHGSEVAFWSNAPEHFASSVQTVPLLPGTEIILESTANGPAGEFYERTQDAIAGRGDYQLIFVPWFLSPEYRRDPEPGFELTTDATEGDLSDAEYAEMHSLDMQQMAWRRAKIHELRSESLFRQEYPATLHEAFSRVVGGMEPFIAPNLVLRARKRTIEGTGPLILGVDPAALGGDRFSIAARRGNQVEWINYRTKIDAQEGIAWVRSLIDKHQPARVNVDAGGFGHAIITGLRSIGPLYAQVTRAVNFGGTSEHRLAMPKVPGPWNRRAEMWNRLKEWLEDVSGACLPDMDALQSDMCSPRIKPRLDNSFLLESKEDMKKRGIRSPDLADAVALTFAFREYHPKYHTPSVTPSFGIPEERRSVATPQLAPAGPNGWMG